MKILHVIPDDGKGGWPFVHLSIKALSSSRQIDNRTCSSTNKSIFGVVRTLFEIKAVNPDWVVVHYGGLCSAMVVTFFKHKGIVYFRGSDRNFSIFGRRVRNLVLRLFDYISHQGAGVIYVSTEVRERRQTRCRRWSVIPSPYNPLLDDVARGVVLTRACGVVNKRKTRVFFYAGNKRAEKGGWVVDTLRSELREQVEVVEVASAQMMPEELYRVIAGCDFTLHPSICEGSPNIPRESILLGVPVLAYPAGDLNETATYVRSIILCKDIEDYIKYLSGNCAVTVSDLDRKYIKEQFSVDSFGRKFLTFLEGLC